MFAQSEGEGRGATFTLELPRLIAQTDMSRILIVEDEQHIADGLRFNLEAEGHEVDRRARRRAGARRCCWTSGARSTSSSST